MNTIQERITQLSDNDIVRLTLWIFDEIREQIGGDLAEATMKELNSEDITMAFNSALKNLELQPITELPDNETIVKIFRTLLIDLAKDKPAIVEETMAGLGMEAGWETELVNLIQEIGVSNLILILVVLKLNFRLETKSFKLDPKTGKIIQEGSYFGTDSSFFKGVAEIISRFFDSHCKG